LVWGKNTSDFVHIFKYPYDIFQFDPSQVFCGQNNVKTMFGNLIQRLDQDQHLWVFLGGFFWCKAWNI